jgi:hypothetical protein
MAAAPDMTAVSQKGAISGLQAVIDTLDSQVKEGVIASDLSVKINEAANTLELRGGAAQLVVKMQRWVRILKTYGRVDPISPGDIQKLRKDMQAWAKELAKSR